MDTFLIKAVQLIIALAFLVIIHEFGHFLFARMFGVRVEKFYIFFDPWVELFKWKPRKYIGGCGKTRKLKGADAERVDADGKKRKPGFWNDTEYGIGWLPLGGYCKISGMIDESMDTEQMKQPAQEWEFRSKPAWQRLLIMIAGVLFNFLLAIVIYSGCLPRARNTCRSARPRWVWPSATPPTAPVSATATYHWQPTARN